MARGTKKSLEEISKMFPVGDTITVIEDENVNTSAPIADELNDVDVRSLYICIDEINERLNNIETAVTGFINEIRPLIEDFVNSPVAKMIGGFFGGKGK